MNKSRCCDTGADDRRDIYMCQVNETVSCGACCGLYNLPDLSREGLEVLLAERTRAFASVARSEDGIFAFKRQHQAPHRLTRPFPQFHHCPFLGLIGVGHSRVGCLLHPDAPGNNGVDYRSLSWYGEQACREYFCPATRKLPDIYRSILIQAIDNWYIFGLIVTEHALVNGYFREVELRLGRPVKVSDYVGNIRALHTVRAFAELKSEWPYRRDDCSGPCNFFFENGLYLRPGVFRAAPDIPLSPFEQILGELDAGFSSAAELAAADRLLDNLFVQSVRAIL